jgi:hypothetical protein
MLAISRQSLVAILLTAAQAHPAIAQSACDHLGFAKNRLSQMPPASQMQQCLSIQQYCIVAV